MKSIYVKNLLKLKLNEKKDKISLFFYDNNLDLKTENHKKFSKITFKNLVIKKVLNEKSIIHPLRKLSFIMVNDSTNMILNSNVNFFFLVIDENLIKAKKVYSACKLNSIYIAYNLFEVLKKILLIILFFNVKLKT